MTPEQRDPEDYSRRVKTLIDRHAPVSGVRPTGKVNTEELPESEDLKKFKTNIQRKVLELLGRMDSSLRELGKVLPEESGPVKLALPQHKLCSGLSRIVKDFSDCVSNQQVTEAKYTAFKADISAQLAKYSELKKPDSPFQSLHKLLVSCVRAFFRVFDVLFNIGSKQTWNDTPGREPFIKPAEVSFSKQMVALERVFNDTIDALDQETSKRFTSGPHPI